MASADALFQSPDSPSRPGDHLAGASRSGPWCHGPDRAGVNRQQKTRRGGFLLKAPKAYFLALAALAAALAELAAGLASLAFASFLSSLEAVFVSFLSSFA